EKFLVPCHQINSIPGASFAGFYYICLRRSKPSIFGFYYHQTSEWFQSLELEYIDTRTSGTYKFL
ncbi:MAG: GID complex subunit 4, VID24, partial [Marteilia pararefringens]